MARLFAGDGITIPQISDVFEWGQMAISSIDDRHGGPYTCLTLISQCIIALDV